MSKELLAWLAQIAAEQDQNFPMSGPSWDAWLVETFQEWGALSTRDLRDLAEMSGDRLMELELMAARELIPAIVADGRAVGMTLDVIPRTDLTGNLEVLASFEPGGRYYWASNGGLGWPSASEAHLLAWLADEVQEATMERAQVNCFVWPTCNLHQLGAHADVEDGVAVWVCNGEGGHVLAPIGRLGKSDPRRRGSS